MGDYPFSIADTIAFVSTLLALVLGWIAAVQKRRTNQLQQENTALHERLVKLEEAREADRQEDKKSASLYGVLQKRPGRKRMRDMLIIKNKGKADARNITLQIDSCPIEKARGFFPDKMPISLLPAGEETGILAALNKDHAPPFLLAITWDDESGKPRTNEITLTTPL